MPIVIDQPIPARHRSRCEFCREELDVRANGVYQYTSGWVMQRDGGGGHGISLPERAPRFAHRRCVEERAKGTANQNPLF